MFNWIRRLIGSPTIYVTVPPMPAYSELWEETCRYREWLGREFGSYDLLQISVYLKYLRKHDPTEPHYTDADRREALAARLRGDATVAEQTARARVVLSQTRRKP